MNLVTHFCHAFHCNNTISPALIQAGLASIKQRMINEIGRYGLNPKFTEVEARSIQQTSDEIKKR